ncbi:MAG: rhodanese-like domain-containing protein [Arcicella sp.]|nr:rhodanese-like domain-containing protein [Arcicella sp.]
MFSFFKTKKNYQNVDSITFNKLLGETPNAVLIDVRTSAEFKEKSIDGAINIDVMKSEFSEKIALLDTDKTYFMYCRSGNRSGNACNMMDALGFSNLYNLSGGLMKWTF